MRISRPVERSFGAIAVFVTALAVAVFFFCNQATSTLADEKDGDPRLLRRWSMCQDVRAGEELAIPVAPADYNTILKDIVIGFRQVSDAEFAVHHSKEKSSHRQIFFKGIHYMTQTGGAGIGGGPGGSMAGGAGGTRFTAGNSFTSGIVIAGKTPAVFEILKKRKNDKREFTVTLCGTMEPISE